MVKIATLAKTETVNSKHKKVQHMKFIFYTLTFFLSVCDIFGQSKFLTNTEVKEMFNDSVKSKFNIDYSIFRVYLYNDKTGKHFVALTEKIDSITSANDTLHHKIKAIKFSTGPIGLEKKWEINDLILKENDENSIWFWTKYCDFSDIDADGIIDPILVYGTSGLNGYDDGRIKILLFYRGQKIAIRHQNGVLDFQRNTQVDQAFYLLDLSIQNRIKDVMQKMIDSNHAIFPYGWQNAMKKQKLKFDEMQ